MLVLHFLAITAFAATAPDYGKIPLHFEPNQGQAPAGVHYVAHAAEYTLMVGDTGAALSRAGEATVEMRLLKAYKPSVVRGEGKLPGNSNYFTSPDPTRWLRDIPQYRSVRLPEVYPGIDLVYYGNQRKIEYDFVIAPGSNPNRIQFTFEGAEGASLDENGDLLLKTSSGVIRQHRPVAYQTAGSGRKPVEVSYKLEGSTVRFMFGRYDRGKALIIDPTLAYSTFYGANFSVGQAIAVDSTGAAYVTGFLVSPTDQSMKAVLKINPSGTAFVYVTYLSATPVAIAVDTSGSAYVTGYSQGGLALKTPFQSAAKGFDMFLTKLNPQGNDLVYSTYIGGSGGDFGYGIVVDSTGAAYIAGNSNSTDFPTRNPVQSMMHGNFDAVVLKMNPQGSDLVFSTYLGGGGGDNVSGITLDKLGNVWIAGPTDSTDFPLHNQLFNVNGGSYLSKLSPDGANLLFSTYLPIYAGTPVCDSANNVYLGGALNTNIVLGQPAGIHSLLKVNAAATDMTVLLNIPGATVGALAIDSSDRLYVGGSARVGLPLVRPMQTCSTDSNDDAFLMKVTNAGSILYSTCLGGSGTDSIKAIAADASGSAFVTGGSGSVDFPVFNPVVNNGGNDAFFAKVLDSPDTKIVAVNVTAAAALPNTGLEVVVDGVKSTNSFNNWQAGTTHTISTAVMQGSGSLRYAFQNWSDGGASTHTITVPSNVDSLTITANFQVQIQLITDVFPAGKGTVTVTPGSADGFYPLNTVVTLTATPAAGYYFLGWAGSLSGSTNPQSLTLNYTVNPPLKSVVANFTTTPPPVVSSALGFVPVTPCRLVDTRPGEGKSGLFGPPILTANTSRDIPVPQGGCNIPTTAKAYSLNVTVVPSGPLGFLTAWPTGQSRPTDVSTLNAFEGQVVANAAIVPAGSAGSISVYVTNDTHVIIDINGYFTDSTGPEALLFYSLAPCRVADTRTGSGGPGGAFGPPSLAAGATRDFTATQSGCQVPASARAFVLNLTAVPKGPLSYIAAWPTGVPRPLVSSLNSFQGRVLANAAIIPASSGGSISVVASDPTDLIIDVNGYFAPAGGSNALHFYTVTPCRVSDTRQQGQGPMMGEHETRQIQIGNVCGVPASAAAYSLNATVVPTGYLGFLTLWPFGTSQPFVSTLNAWEGQVAANAAIVPARQQAISAFTSNPTQLIIDVDGYFAP